MTTLYDSFKQALPSFPTYGSQIETYAKPSGTTTAECTPPTCGIRIPLKHWTDLASRLCIEQHADNLRSADLPKFQNHVGFKSEADVVKASTMYLEYPVHTAYELAYPSGVHLDQLTKPGKDIHSSRVDMAYFSGPPSDEETPGKSNNIFAVMEYKKFGGLSGDQFNRGIVTNFNDYERAQREPRFIKTDSNAKVFLQQATHYAWRYGTPFVALCDYKMLVLLVMDQVEQRHGGRYSYMTVVENSAVMRKVYLGFLLAARLHAENNEDWRKSRTGEDLFVKAEEWEQELRSGKLRDNQERDARNPDPAHDVPSSQDTDASMVHNG